jgi:hypothetical protein
MHLTEKSTEGKPQSATPRPSARWAHLVTIMLDLAELDIILGISSPPRIIPALRRMFLANAADLLDHARFCGEVSLILEGRRMHLLQAVRS